MNEDRRVSLTVDDPSLEAAVRPNRARTGKEADGYG
jgi:hypothetical protein